MLKLICGTTPGSDLLYSADAVYRSCSNTSRVAEPEEPIRVSVRVRSSGDAYPNISRSHSCRLDSGTLPVGSNLDCFL